MDRPRQKVFWTRQRITGLVFALALVPLTLYALFADLGTSKLRVEHDRITISTVTRGPFQEFIPITGDVRPLHTVYLETVEGGRVEEIFIKGGNMVAPGDRIFRLVNTDLQAETMRREDLYLEQLDQLFNGKEQMEQQNRLFEQRMMELDYRILKQKRQYQRNIALSEAKLISDLDYELSRDEYNFLLRQKELEMAKEEEQRRFREAQIRQLEQTAERRKQNLELAEQSLERLVIRAPIAGQLTMPEIEVGESMMPGDRLGQVDGTDGFRVRAGIDQHYISRVDEGKTGEWDFSGKIYKLRIFKIYPEVMEGKFAVDMEFLDEVPQSIKRGLTLHIRLALSGLSEAVQLANGGFFQKTGGQWVFVVDPAGDFAVKRDIRLGRHNTEFYEVLEGLEPGEQVITSTYESFEDFDQVVIRR
jgi:HlyD family secretion protein